MAHNEQRYFITSVKASFPEFFKGKRVLDIGSLDINGNNKTHFEQCDYTGVDIAPGRNVDVVSVGHEYDSDKPYDVVISTECFEHDRFYDKTLLNCVRLLKSEGLFVFTCATTNRPEHGTRRTDAYSSPATVKIEEWADYYKNLTEADIREGLDMDMLFLSHSFSVNTKSHDLYFYGIKR